MFSGLTKQEQRVLLGLIIVIVIGLGVRYIQKHREKDVIYIDREKTTNTNALSGQGLIQGVSDKYSSRAGWSRFGQETAQKSRAELSKYKGKIDLNTATIEDLIALPGIGPARASAILNYRDSIGGFRLLEQVKDAPMVGKKTFELIKTRFYVQPTGLQKAPPSARTQNTLQTQPPESAPKVNINTATLDELCRLEGVNEAIALRIIEYRKKYGKFERPEDIMKVQGVSEKKFLQNKHRITVR
ncbi:helix-hairpin-helix domain-containing protein [Candidatus Sumerlaeota bacterium]|nr:helix-hairpin-helix domain-containing protein [Candidatus Sumerlaeota bacterium]